MCGAGGGPRCNAASTGSRCAAAASGGGSTASPFAVAATSTAGRRLAKLTRACANRARGSPAPRYAAAVAPRKTSTPQRGARRATSPRRSSACAPRATAKPCGSSTHTSPRCKPRVRPTASCTGCGSVAHPPLRSCASFSPARDRSPTTRLTTRTGHAIGVPARRAGPTRCACRTRRDLPPVRALDHHHHRPLPDHPDRAQPTALGDLDHPPRPARPSPSLAGCQRPRRPLPCPRRPRLRRLATPATAHPRHHRPTRRRPLGDRRHHHPLSDQTVPALEQQDQAHSAARRIGRTQRSTRHRAADSHRRRLITQLVINPELELRTRVAGLLILLYGQPLARITRLRVADIHHYNDQTSITLGRDRLALPAPIDQLVHKLRPPRRQHASRPHRRPLAVPRSARRRSHHTRTAPTPPRPALGPLPIRHGRHSAITGCCKQHQRRSSPTSSASANRAERWSRRRHHLQQLHRRRLSLRHPRNTSRRSTGQTLRAHSRQIRPAQTSHRCRF